MEEIRNGIYEDSRTMENGNIKQIAWTAHHLIALHGDDAPTVAAANAADCEKAGDVDGRTDWLCVMIRTQNAILNRQAS